jgi:hypothetical protein
VPSSSRLAAVNAWLSVQRLLRADGKITKVYESGFVWQGSTSPLQKLVNASNGEYFEIDVPTINGETLVPSL